jgi:hypothetical protein
LHSFEEDTYFFAAGVEDCSRCLSVSVPVVLAVRFVVPFGVSVSICGGFVRLVFFASDDIPPIHRLEEESHVFGPRRVILVGQSIEAAFRVLEDIFLGRHFDGLG